MSGVTQGQRAAWQRCAVAELANILEQNGELPRVAWTVSSAGCALFGRVNSGDTEAAARATFESWRRAVGLDERAEVASNGAVLLRATAHRGTVKVTIVATVTTDDDAGEEL